MIHNYTSAPTSPAALPWRGADANCSVCCRGSLGVQEEAQDFPELVEGKRIYSGKVNTSCFLQRDCFLKKIDLPCFNIKVM